MKKSELKKIAYYTIGCRLNQYETERMAAALYPFGFRRAAPGEKADLYLINTCTVTQRADQSSRHIIRRAARENPTAKVVVAGCYVDSDPALTAAITGVDITLHNREKDFIAEILPERLPELFKGLKPDPEFKADIADFCGHNRTWLKISDGCDQCCAYCILPLVRGPLTNRPAGEIIDEINQLVESGFEEIVITGLNMGMYKDHEAEKPVKNLAALCRMIISDTDIRRIRLSSVEPQTINDDLIKVFADSAGRICRHWHLSLQSGSSRILKLMRRPYTREKFIERALSLKNALPNTVIGADIIVGFPGETDDDFNESKTLSELNLLDYLHVFSYSDRPGTEAEKMPDKINSEIIKERSGVLTDISKQNRRKAHLRQVGETLGVIAENKKRGGNFYWAVADNYLRVKMPESFEGGKQIVEVKITAAFDAYLEGEIV
ncbi:MAG: tRNA (N(6)-L-threonylcarbamoyladenosine(37)-C(2))-methylthiotransferase MtaB [candidate division Zixibacteria bacterium]|nr:tRNA (N(6)-L-threonylcarbamoyladenosine(37)-C(2))-methylthiotransferase MtaB [candidate division Zixibacteria bacterium]